ncbi:DEAD/DEAH box helicase [Alistipes sp. An116]|uniref:DEAD/DEAH box helicase n=1 Tax=Alistipes sp. An116 TaxID=1965546 RepID=UPI000B365641|nr:DEAD/DEAH box helicase [Alistipes sp. An116]
MKFQDLGLSAPLLRAVSEKGYETPTPIQEQAIPPALEGRDLQGCAQTGTGKTAAFTLPILQLLAQEPPVRGRRPIRALVLTPTRELAIQIDECCRDYARYTPIRHCVIFGGVNQRPQVEALERGVDLLVATPGRLLDLIGQGYITLDAIRFFILDEADRMLDMGFIHDIRRILPLLPAKRQTLFFSATMPEEIAALAARILHDPVLVTVTPPASVVETIAQRVYFAEKSEKSELLIRLLRESDARQVLVFTRTKHGADRLARILNRAGIDAAAIHGNKSQNARVRAMNDFKSGACRVLIATDIAARGIDIDQLPLVVNYDLPEVAETYVHRIGRTGRAGREGSAWSFCSEAELEYLLGIQKLTGLILPIEGETPAYAAEALEEAARRQARADRKSRSAKPTAPKRNTPAAQTSAASSAAPATSEGEKTQPSGQPAPTRKSPRATAPTAAGKVAAPAQETIPDSKATVRSAEATASTVRETTPNAGERAGTVPKRRRRHRRRGAAATPDAATSAPSGHFSRKPEQAPEVSAGQPAPVKEAARDMAQPKSAPTKSSSRNAAQPKPNSGHAGKRPAAPTSRSASTEPRPEPSPSRNTRPRNDRNNDRSHGRAKTSPKGSPRTDRTPRPEVREENRISHTNDWKNRVKSLLLRTFGK